MKKDFFYDMSFYCETNKFLMVRKIHVYIDDCLATMCTGWCHYSRVTLNLDNLNRSQSSHDQIKLEVITLNASISATRVFPPLVGSE